MSALKRNFAWFLMSSFDMLCSASSDRAWVPRGGARFGFGAGAKDTEPSGKHLPPVIPKESVDKFGLMKSTRLAFSGGRRPVGAGAVGRLVAVGLGGPERTTQSESGSSAAIMLTAGAGGASMGISSPMKSFSLSYRFASL